MKNFLLLFFLMGTSIGAAQNLVPNPSFEEVNSCIIIEGDFDPCESWFRLFSSPDVYNGCVEDGQIWQMDVPVVNQGNQTARTGVGMAGVFASERIYGAGIREYVHVQLTEPLESGTDYYIQYYAQLQDSSYYGIGTLGAYVSDEATLGDYGAQGQMVVEPQVVYAEGQAIVDKTSWTKVSGWYTPENTGEQYLALGNFFIDSLSLIENIIHPTLGRSYYFIDDVCISADPSDCGFTNSIESVATENCELLAFPNPNNGQFEISNCSKGEPYVLQVFTAQGKAMSYKSIEESNDFIQINLGEVPSGFYIVTLRTDTFKRTEKVLVIH